MHWDLPSVLVLPLGYKVICELVNPAPQACTPCAGMMSYPNSHRLTTVWYELSAISILTPSPSTGHISALRCRLLEILGAFQSSQWVLFSDWIYKLINTRTFARSGFPPLAAQFTLLQYTTVLCCAVIHGSIKSQSCPDSSPHKWGQNTTRIGILRVILRATRLSKTKRTTTVSGKTDSNSVWSFPH